MSFDPESLKRRVIKLTPTTTVGTPASGVHLSASYREGLKKAKEDIVKYGLEKVKAENQLAEKQKKTYAARKIFIERAEKELESESIPAPKKLVLRRKKVVEPKPKPEPKSKSKKVVIEDTTPFNVKVPKGYGESEDKLSFNPQKTRKIEKPKKGKSGDLSHPMYADF